MHYAYTIFADMPLFAGTYGLKYQINESINVVASFNNVHFENSISRFHVSKNDLSLLKTQVFIISIKSLGKLRNLEWQISQKKKVDGSVLKR